MKLLLVLCAFVIAAQAVPFKGKALEDDVAIAKREVDDFDIVTLELANELQYFNLRVDLEIVPISKEIIDQMTALNISEVEIAQQQVDFETSFGLIQTGVRDVDNRLRQLRNTLSGMHDSLVDSNWNQLRSQETRLRSETATIETNYNTTLTDLKASLITLENDLVASLANETSEDFAAVIGNWNRIIDIFEFASREVTSWKIIYDTRLGSTKNAVDVVLDQVRRRAALAALPQKRPIVKFNDGHL